MGGALRGVRLRAGPGGRHGLTGGGGLRWKTAPLALRHCAARLHALLRATVPAGAQGEGFNLSLMTRRQESARRTQLLLQLVRREDLAEFSSIPRSVGERDDVLTVVILEHVDTGFGHLE